MLEVNVQLALNSNNHLQALCNIPAGQCMGLMGDSGAGKTTLLHAIAGLVRPNTGSIKLGGQLWCNTHQAINLAPRLRQVGLVFQDIRLFPHMNVQQNLTYGIKEHIASQAHRSKTTSTNAFELEEVCRIFAITALLQKKPSQLSGGEQRRVAIGRALLSQPSLLLLDEPMNGLDASLKQQILPYLKRMIETLQLPTIYVSHNQDEIAQIAHFSTILKNGKIDLISMHEGRFQV